MAAPTVAQVASTGTGFASTVALAIPAGAAVGDFLVIHVTWRGDRTFSSIAGVADLVLQGAEARSSSASTGSVSRIYTKQLASGDPGTTVTVTLSAGSWNAMEMIVVSGFDTTTPVPDTVVTDVATSGTTFAADGVTTSVADSLLVIGVGENNGAANTATISPPASMTEQAEGQGTERTAGTLNTEAIASPGATGTRTFTGEEGGNWSSVALAIAPAVAATKAPPIAGRVRRLLPLLVR